MDDYVDRMLDEFTIKFKENDKVETPASTTLLMLAKAHPSIPRNMTSSIHLLQKTYFYPSEHV